MKRLLIALALFSAHSFAQDVYAPSGSSLSRLCQSEGHKMATFGKCLAGKLDKYRPEWRSAGKGYEDMQWLVGFLETLGARVKKKELSNAEAEKLFIAQAQSMMYQKQAQMRAAEAERERQKLAEENQRKAAFEREQQYRREQEQAERDRVQYEFLQAQLRLQEEQARQQRNQRIFEAGVQLMQMGQPRYSPPPPMPINCTSSRWNGMVTTTCQ